MRYCWSVRNCLLILFLLQYKAPGFATAAQGSEKLTRRHRSRRLMQACGTGMDLATQLATGCFGASVSSPPPPPGPGGTPGNFPLLTAGNSQPNQATLNYQAPSPSPPQTGTSANAFASASASGASASASSQSSGSGSTTPSPTSPAQSQQSPGGNGGGGSSPITTTPL